MKRALGIAVLTFTFVLPAVAGGLNRYEWCGLIGKLYNACYQLSSAKDLSACIQAGKTVYNRMDDKYLGKKLSVFCSGVCVAAILHKDDLLKQAQDYINNCYNQ